MLYVHKTLGNSKYNIKYKFYLKNKHRSASKSNRSKKTR